jgi:hypothetical protein
MQKTIRVPAFGCLSVESFFVHALDPTKRVEGPWTDSDKELSSVQ